MEEYMQKEMNNEVLAVAARLYGVPVESITSIGGFENFVYEFHKDQQDYILRFVHSGHRTFELVLAEIEFIDYLAINEANVSKVVHSVNNQIVEKISLNNTHYFSVSAFEKAPGTYVTVADLSPELYQKLGQGVGKMHRLTKEFNPVHRRLHWHEENFRDVAIRALDEEDKDILVLFDQISSTIKTFPMNKDNYGLIHTDLHFHNMYYDQDKLTFFDFDDCAYKHFLSDIAIIIYYHFMHQRLEKEEYNQKVRFVLTNLMKGYQLENKIPQNFFDNLNEFILLRSVVLYIVLVAAGYKNSEDSRKSDYAKFAKSTAINHRMKLDLDYVLKDLQWNL